MLLKKPMKVTVTSIRYGMTEPQLGEFIESYKGARGRIVPEILLSKGICRTRVHEFGMTIDTIISIEPMKDSEMAGTR